MPSGGGDLQRAARRLLPFDVCQIRQCLIISFEIRLWTPQRLQALEVIHEREQVRRSDDIHIGCGPCCLGPILGSANQTFFHGVRADGRRQRTRRWPNLPIQRQFANSSVALDCVGRNRLHGDHQSQGYRQIEMAALLRKIGWREVYGDVRPWKAEPDCVERVAHTLATFRDRLIRQSDDCECVLSRADPDLHLYRACLDADKRQRGDPTVHTAPLNKNLLGRKLFRETPLGQEHNKNIPDCESVAGHAFLNRIPENRRDVRPTKRLDLTDARRRSDVDLREIRSDHVDSRENQSTAFQLRL